VAFVFHARNLVKIVEVRLHDVKYVCMILPRNIFMVQLVMRFALKVQHQMMMLLNARAVMLVVQFVNQKIQKYVLNVMILYTYSKVNVFQFVQSIIDLAFSEKLVSQKLLFPLFTSLSGFWLFLCYLFQLQVNLAQKMYQASIEFSCHFIVGSEF
jgi:hypothetical protein